MDALILVLGTVASSVDLTPIFDMLLNTGVFAVLFVWLFYDARKESKNREDRLMNHIERQGEALDRITDTIEKMDVRLNHIEKQINHHTKDDS